MIKWILVFVFAAQKLFCAEATLLSSYTWELPDDAFGGFSSLELDEFGQSFLATSDKGHFLSGKIKRQNGKIIEVTHQKLIPIQNTHGIAVTGKKIDAEGLAIGADGTIYVSFERKHRVWAYRSPNTKAFKLPKHPEFKAIKYNYSLEALAIDQKGWLYTIPERSGHLNKPFPVFRYNKKRWDNILTIPRRGDYVVTGADIGPDGKFYLLERDYLIPLGFTTRLRRFTMTVAKFIEEQEVLTTSYGTHDNLEGISVWRDDQNKIRITLISDDNYNFIQKTELVEYVID